MKNLFSMYLRRHLTQSLILLGLTLFFLFKVIFNRATVSDSTPVSVIGVHHLGQDYFINRFYINKSIGDSIGEHGGGGSHICCVKLPDEWTVKLSAEVRWEVRRIVKPSNPSLPETAEVVGMYKAQVPIEKYDHPASFWVHFFSDGKVRIVVTPFSFDGDNHPIHWEDAQASRLASLGKTIDVFFTTEEISEFVHQAELDRKRYGDWR